MHKLSTDIRKEQLIRGVLKVIARDGTKRLSVASVSREIGLVPSALYRHFHSKDQMLSAVLDYIIGRIQHNFHEVCEETEEPLLRMQRFLQRQLKLIRESPAIPTVVFAQGLFSEDPNRRKKIFDVLNQFRHRLATMVKMGQKAGTIRNDISAETVVLLWVGIIQPAALLYYLSNGHYDLELHGRKAWKLLKQMIQTKRK
jgi:TetR/AcrR family transcriptional regulator, fatty acid metabolism regulator protein